MEPGIFNFEVKKILCKTSTVSAAAQLKKP